MFKRLKLKPQKIIIGNKNRNIIKLLIINEVKKIFFNLKI